MEITNDRDLTHDPLFGIEVLRSVAVKSAELGDTDVIKSCITGLFRILHYALIHKDIIGIPFTLTTEDSKRKINKMKFQEIENNNIKENHIDTNNEPLQTSTLKAIINPKEILLDSVILVELSVIIDKILITRNVPIINHIVSEYIAQCNSLVRKDKHQEFRMLTDWCSGQLSLVSKALPPHLSSSFIEQLLTFKKDLEKGQPQFAKLFDIYMKNIISIS